MSDDLVVREERFIRSDMRADEIRMGIRMMSVGPAGEEWLTACTPGWRDHVSTLDMNVQLSIAEAEVLRTASPMELIKGCRAVLAKELAHKIVDRLEPITSRYTYGSYEPIRAPS
jgi:hypothetical protein